MRTGAIAFVAASLVLLFSVDLHHLYGESEILDVNSEVVADNEKNLIRNKAALPYFYNFKKLRKESKYEEAVNELKKAVSIEENNPMFYGNLADAYYYLGEYDQSLIYCQKVLALSPEEIRILPIMAFNYYKLGRYKEGNALYAKFEAAFLVNNERDAEYYSFVETEIQSLEQDMIKEVNSVDK